MDTTSEVAFVPRVDARPTDSPWPVMTWPPASETRLRGRIVELARADPSTDAAALFEAIDHDEAWRHVAGRPPDADALAADLAAAALLGRLAWVVRLMRPCAELAAGTVVGTSSLLDASPTDSRLEIGWTLYTPSVWATGVNPDTKLELLGLAFDVLGAGRVQLKTDVRNIRSQRAIARLGARYEGTLRRYQQRSDGTVRDTVLFSIVADEWPSVRARLAARVDRAVSGTS